MAPTQQTKDTTWVDLGSLLDAGDGAVVTLMAGDTRLAAHRAVLVERSSVFAAMFAHDTKEAGSGEVCIPDVEGPVLRLLLAFLYTLQVPQVADMAAQLLVAADKYGVSTLKEACEQQVAAQLSVETAAAAAVLAVRHSCDSLRKTAIDFVKANLVQVMATEGWADAVHNQPTDVVEVSRLLADPPAETTAPAPAVSGTSTPACAATQPHSGVRSRHSRAPASAVQATAASHHTPPPDGTTISRLRSLPAEELGRRLIEATKEGAVEEMQALMAAGADVAAMDLVGRTTLHWAAARGHVEAARQLLARGVAVDARDILHRTPLHWAAEEGHVAMVRLLLVASADLSARDCNGWTPLHFAASDCHVETATALLEAGADRGARNDSWDTPLDLVSNCRQLEELLRES